MFCENAFDRCWRMSNVSVWCVLQCCFMISGSWKGQTEAYSVFYICFINVSRKFMWEFVEGCKCSHFVYFIYCFFMTSEKVTVHWFDIGFVYVLWKCIWPLLADVKCSCLVCITMFFYDVGVLEGPTGSIICMLYWFYISFT